MTMITDFYQFKYSRRCCYINLFINRIALINIEEALNERLSNLELTKDTHCAYLRLKELFETSRKYNNSLYVELNINKCYLKYIKNLNNYFYNRNDYMPLHILNDYLRIYLESDIDNISGFSSLNEDIKIKILSNV